MTIMAWLTRGQRGSTLEELINMTNENYRAKGLAVIQKIPTPITPVKTDNLSGNISLAYFERKSTVDYIGAIQGLPVCFDAKETSQKSLPIRNIHEHQVDFMDDFQKQSGLAFIIVNFKMYGECFYLPFEKLKYFWEDAESGGRKSIPYSEFSKKLIIKNKSGFYVHYIETINIYLNNEY